MKAPIDDTGPIPLGHADSTPPEVARFLAGLTARNEEPTTDDKRPPDITTEQMLAIREHARERLIHDIHTHTLTARLYRNVGNIPMSNVEQATVKELQAMLNSLANETEPMKGTSVRLMENE
jgi:hypothetical protein